MRITGWVLVMMALFLNFTPGNVLLFALAVAGLLVWAVGFVLAAVVFDEWLIGRGFVDRAEE